MAIKVNGTTVIDDSRQLQNVASVDATTVAAMGAAGVGGMTTEVAKNAAFGTGNAVKLTLGNYKVQTFDIYNLKASANTYLKGQVTDSSDNVLTASYAYFNTDKNQGSTTFSDRMTVFSGWDLPTSSSNWGITCNIEVYDAYSSTKETRLKIDYRRTEPPGTSYPSYSSYNRFDVIIRGTTAGALRNQSLYLTFGGSVPTFNSGITYDSYGMGTS